MKIERLYPDPRAASQAHSDGAALTAMQDAIARAVAQGVIEAQRHARDLALLDPDAVMAEVEKYFGDAGAWRDLLVDAFWEFEVRSRQEAELAPPPHWSEAGR